MKNLLLCSIVLVGMMFPACHKKSTTQNIPINAAFKAAFNFMPGTYWIYKDSISGEVDSFFVRSYGDGYPYCSGCTQNYEDIGMYISEYNTSLPLPNTDTVGWKFDMGDNEFFANYNESKISAGQIQYSPLFNYPFPTTLSVFPVSPGYLAIGAVIGIYNSYQLNGQSFTNVFEVNQSASIPANANGYIGTPYSYNDTFYICPNVGLIKIALNHPEDSFYRVWQLQRWKITV